MRTIRIELADDHTILRQGLRRILESHPGFVVVAEAESGSEAAEMARLHQPDVAVVDVRLKGLNGIEATAEILRYSPNTAVLMLSMYSDDGYVIGAVKAGARGYLLKDAVEEELIQAIERVHRGESFFGAEVTNVIQEDSRRKPPEDGGDGYPSLTERERQIYGLLAEGNSNKDVASRLGLSLHTVETHRAHLMEKLDLHTPVQLILHAVRRGVVH